MTSTGSHSSRGHGSLSRCRVDLQWWQMAQSPRHPSAFRRTQRCSAIWCRMCRLQRHVLLESTDCRLRCTSRVSVAARTRATCAQDVFRSAAFKLRNPSAHPCATIHDFDALRLTPARQRIDRMGPRRRRRAHTSARRMAPWSCAVRLGRSRHLQWPRFQKYGWSALFSRLCEPRCEGRYPRRAGPW